MNEKWNNYFLGQLSGKEKQELFRELEEHPEQKEEFARMKNVLGLSGLLPQEEDQLQGEQSLQRMMTNNRNKQRKARLWSVVQYAASVAAIIAVTWFATKTYLLPEAAEITYTEIKVPKGQRVHLTLPDGSDVWLSSLSSLRWPSAFSADARNVTLDGEGFFTVAKDSIRPFTVQTGKYNVRVLGTVFNVYAYRASQQFETDLLSGKVAVSSSGSPKEEIQLLPNERAVLSDGRLVKHASYFSGKELREQGIYDFEDQPLGGVLERLEQWYDVSFKVTDPALLDETVSGKFRQSDQIETILNAIRRADLFRYRIKSPREIEIY